MNDKVQVVCPSCGWEQGYRPKKSLAEMRNKRRASCFRCSRSFLVKKNVKAKARQTEADKCEKPGKFFNYKKK